MKENDCHTFVTSTQSNLLKHAVRTSTYIMVRSKSANGYEVSARIDGRTPSCTGYLSH